MNNKINYVIDQNYLDMYKHRNKKKGEAKQDLEYFRKIILNYDVSKEVINIFINMSIQSNGFINFINDEKKYIGKILNIYFHKKDNIEFIIQIYIENNNIMKRLHNIILNSDFDYYTPLKDNIDKYIELNRIINYYIYY